MTIIREIIILLLGFVLLIKGADLFVDGSSNVAKKLKVPSVVIGLTIVAVGTSLPELAVSSMASAKGSNEMAVSNVVGSNIFNLLVVLGVTALFVKIRVKKSILKREFPFLIGISIASIFLMGDLLWFGGIIGKVNIFKFANGEKLAGEVARLDGVLLLFLFIGFIIWTVKYALDQREQIKESVSDEKLMSYKGCAAYIICGAAAIVMGGDCVVDSAKSLALWAGMSETLVGLTIVALGTSLPELVTSAVAAKKGEADLAVGNVVGSNIANLLLVLGTSAVISPVAVTMNNVIDISVSLIATIIVFILIKGKKAIEKREGLLMVFLYLLYMAYIIFRQYMV